MLEQESIIGTLGNWVDLLEAFSRVSLRALVSTTDQNRVIASSDCP